MSSSAIIPTDDVRRGEIYTAATGSGFGGKPRPVVVVQADEYVPSAHIVVALIGSPIDNAPSLRVPVSATPENGLDRDSLVEVDILVTLKHHQFGPRCGVLEADIMEMIDRALLTLLGFNSRR